MNTLMSKWSCGAFLACLVVGLSACGGEPGQAPAAETNAETAIAAAAEEAESVASTETTSVPSDAAAVDQEIVSIYQRSCISCHLSGAAGAPKSHDAAAWAPKLAKGMDALVASINNGLNAMPPKGMCFDCTDEQYAALIDYMAGPKPD